MDLGLSPAGLKCDSKSLCGRQVLVNVPVGDGLCAVAVPGECQKSKHWTNQEAAPFSTFSQLDSHHVRACRTAGKVVKDL
jgi:hypothetical protein